MFALKNTQRHTTRDHIISIHKKQSSGELLNCERKQENGSIERKSQ